MAVVREDVVKVKFDVDDKPLEQVDSGIDKLVQNTQKMAGDSGVGKLTKGFEETAAAAKKMGNTKLGAIKSSLQETKEKLTEGEKGAKGLAKAVKNVAKASLGKLVAGLKKVDAGLTSALKTAGKLALKLGGLAVKGLATGVAAGVAGLGALATAAINSYAEYEQLIGGVDTLFKDNAKTVVKYANDAYKTAGLSANEYMSTVTSFSASLLQSLGGDTKKASALADQAIIDMSDNANKMGTDMSMIQNAYQGFAKQNYTMLDNLKLGYGGTKEEMQRLLKDAEKISGKKFDLSSYADVVSAIHVIQTEMGITGTTAKEASSTIQGSFNAMKSAWTNFLTGMADGEQDFDQLVGNLVDSVVTFGKNLIPRIKILLPRLVEGITALVKSLIPELPGIFAGLLPVLGETVKDIIKAVYKAFTGKEMSGEMFSGLKKQAERAFGAVKKIISGVMTFGQKVMDVLGPVVVWVGDKLLNALVWVGDNIDWLLPLLGSLVTAFLAFKAISSVVSKVKTFASGISTIASKVSGGLGKKLNDVASGTKAAGDAAGQSSANMLASAKSFMMMGAGVLFIAAGFALLAFSAISLANAGWPAIAVMAGLTLALAGLAVGMMFLLKSVSTAGAQMQPAALAMLAMGAAILLISVGFALLAQSAISLAAAGWPAIAVMAGMVAVIALLAIGAAALGTALTAGALGFIAFGAAIALVGVGALLAAVALNLIAGVLPVIAQHGLMGAVSVAALGAGLLVFAAGATLAGVAALVLGAGLLVCAAGLMAAAIPAAVIAVAIVAVAACAGIAAASMTLLAQSLTMAIPAMTMFSVALVPMSAAMLLAAPAVLALAAGFALLMASMVVLSPLTVLFAAAMVLLAPCFAILAAAAPTVAKALEPLPGAMKKMIVPAGLLIVALAPLTVEFAALAVAVTALLAATVGVVASLTLMAALFALITVTSVALRASFAGLVVSAVTLAAALPVLTGALTSMVAPLGGVTVKFAVFAAAAVATAAASAVMVAAFTVMAAVLISTCANMLRFVATTVQIQAAVKVMQAVVVSSFKAMEKAITQSGEQMTASVQRTLLKMVVLISSTNLYSSGVSLMQGLNRGMQSQIPALIATATRAAAAIKKATDVELKIHSPSRVMEDSGENAGLGQIKGLRNTIPDMQIAARDVSNASIPYDTYSPDSGSTYYSGGESSYTTVSPQFNLTISGTQDDRAMARRVKRYVSEAIQETFESLERKSYSLREA